MVVVVTVMFVDDATAAANAVLAVPEHMHCRVPYSSEHPYSLAWAATNKFMKIIRSVVRHLVL